MYFGHKHVETEPNFSHELSTFLKYHMPLKKGCTKMIVKSNTFEESNSMLHQESQFAESNFTRN